MGKRHQALKPMRKAAELDPTDGYGQRVLGAILIGTGRADEALPQLREARKALPPGAQATFGRATAR